MDQPSFGRLFQFARELQSAVTFSDMLALVRDEIEAVIGYRHAWLCIFEPDLKSARILATSSEHERAIWEHAKASGVSMAGIKGRGRSRTAPMAQGCTIIKGRIALELKYVKYRAAQWIIALKKIAQ